ncbi:MAG: ABC transporter ATP-binding protein [Rhodospirillales bacterium]|nr:ABC transporter ATP-binding protein [Rhodospirillales bacterium]
METESLCVAYGRERVLRGIDLRAAPGTVTALIGPNGSGKSTLLRAIAGLVPSTGGIRRPSGRIGYLPQDGNARAVLTVLEVVLLGRLHTLGLAVGRADIEAAAEVLHDLGLEHLGDRHLGEISGGQRQMVYLAQVVAAAPTALLLDEPTSALDLRNQMDMLDQVRRLTRARNLATIVAIHDLNAAARFADQVVALDRGRLVAAGTPADVLTAALLAQVYRIEALVVAGADGLPSIAPLRAHPSFPRTMKESRP